MRTMPVSLAFTRVMDLVRLVLCWTRFACAKNGYDEACSSYLEPRVYLMELSATIVEGPDSHDPLMLMLPR
jgi:hypothetical protein